MQMIIIEIDKEEEWCHLGAGLRSMTMLLGGRELKGKFCYDRGEEPRYSYSLVG